MTAMSARQWLAQPRVPENVRRLVADLDADLARARSERDLARQGQDQARREQADLLAQVLSVQAPLSMAAHAAYVRGERDEWVKAGERIYNREWKRARAAKNGRIT